jgi:hypothetical protein
VGQAFDIFFVYKNSKQYLATHLVVYMMMVVQVDVECCFHSNVAQIN